MVEVIRVEFADIETNLDKQAQLVDRVVLEFACIEASLPSLSETSSPSMSTPSTSGSCSSVVERSWNDPVLIANSLFGFVNVLAFTRILPFLVANEFVGQLVISLADMIVKTSSFFLFVIAVIVSFSASLTFNFAYYSNLAEKECELYKKPPGCEENVYYYQK